jgi:hypothetical protein
VETPLPPVSPGEVEIPAVETAPVFGPGLPVPGDGVSALMDGTTLPDLFSFASLSPELIGIAVGAFLAFLCVRQLWRMAPALGGSRSISLINPENRARGMESLPTLLGRVLPETLAAGAAVLAAGHGLLTPALTSWAPWQWALIGGTALRLALYAAALGHGAGHALASKIVSPGGTAGHFTLLTGC